MRQVETMERGANISESAGVRMFVPPCKGKDGDLPIKATWCEEVEGFKGKSWLKKKIKHHDNNSAPTI